MKHEHAMCQANNIKQKCLLEGNSTKKKNQICSFFPLSFIFRILPYVFLLFYIPFFLISTLTTISCLKYRGIWKNFDFLIKKKVKDLSFELPLVYKSMSIIYEN